MLQISVIGNIGADAEVHRENGNVFTTFKVAHNDRFTDSQGVNHDSTTWVSCVLNGDAGNLLQYLKKGTAVYVSGDAGVRTYHSKTARQLVAGVDCRVRTIQLLAGKSDPVPAVLFDENGLQINVTKYFKTEVKKAGQLYDRNGVAFNIDKNGWVSTIAPQSTDEA